MVGTDSAYRALQNDPVVLNNNISPKTLSDSQQTGPVPNVTVTGNLLYTNRVATHVYGAVASAVALFFLYRKVFKSTKYMYIPMLVSAVATGLYLYNIISFMTDPSIMNITSDSAVNKAADQAFSIHAGGTTAREYENWHYLTMQLFTLRMDLGASVAGMLAHLGTIVYLFNRRV
jgi:hypothetical protein